MSNIVIISILIVILLIVILNKISCIGQNCSIGQENYMSINILDIKSNQIPLILTSMLKDIDSLFNKYGITYWLDKETLVNAVLFGQSPKNKANICVLYLDRDKIPELKNFLNNMGYNVVKFWEGYKIFPVNGVSLKDYNYDWMKHDFDTLNRGKFPKRYDEDYGYMFPYITIVFCDNYPIKKGKNNIYRYSNRYARQMFPYNQIQKSDLFPLKRVALKNGLHLSIPNNSREYIQNIYLSQKFGYKSRQPIYQRYTPLWERKVAPLRNE